MVFLRTSALAGALLGLAGGALAPSAAAAADRAPGYASGGFDLGLATGLVGDWGAVRPSGGVHAAVGRWNDSQRVGLEAGLGYQVMSRRLEPIGSLFDGVADRFKLVPVHAGMRFNLRPQPDWLQINVVVDAIATLGAHTFEGDGRTLGRIGVLGIGGDVGVEMLTVRQKRTGLPLAAKWVFEPTLQPVNSGFLAQGLVGLGGPQISASFVTFLGAPK